MNVIKRRGSILEGSSLDPDASAESDAAAWGTSTSIRARAAEQLLRAARLLDMAEPVTERRADLCRQMRAEAAKLLSE